MQVTPDFLPKAGDLGPQSPVPPAQALAEDLKERIVPGGSSGRAEVKILDASIVSSHGTLNGAMAVHVDVYTGSGTRSGFAEARVTRALTDPDRGPHALQAALYDVTKGMMNDMNVELEYQVRHSLKDWLQDTSMTSVPGAVQQQTLQAPPGVKTAPLPEPVAPATPGSTAAGPSPTTLSPPSGVLTLPKR
ncbi:Hypothetical protein GbCGDNIH3_2268 [Granulibacter bethesdensis]|uniref:Uncharacterized protein n=1 Tax=Granulibacter bethesdensis TaxID=364410 RepID=A0AAN0RFL6_9PROT|nr:Hypothetical protein GbCGDNIH3_2268 [Granulibacter bethesdensis]